MNTLKDTRINAWLKNTLTIIDNVLGPLPRAISGNKIQKQLFYHGSAVWILFPGFVLRDKCLKKDQFILNKMTGRIMSRVLWCNGYHFGL